MRRPLKSEIFLMLSSPASLYSRASFMTRKKANKFVDSLPSGVIAFVFYNEKSGELGMFERTSSIKLSELIVVKNALDKTILKLLLLNSKRPNNDNA